ncbi:hypothetical protein GM658_11945 [Pseudoduganella eburnea]|uniref:Uncharacterized protein n=1 Tax=Massilia eburnea TaxID=1776165 RepID=A0A6L6QI34_9BURK|nr:hypothetical protein [Massilia eburnea]MTW11306.1 hypothetical protein [Massilia eburnea]
MRVGLWAPAVLLAVAGTCSAQEAWRGIWEGTIGKQPVRVCLDDDARYYYLKYREDIHLEPVEGADGGWRETAGYQDEPTGKWQLAQAGADSLRGIWSSPDASKQAPIRLKRTSAARSTDRNLCEAGQFFKPVADAEKLIAGPVKKFGRHGYQELSTRIQERGNQESFVPNAIVLRDYGAIGAAVNQTLQERLRQRLARHHDTRMNGLAESFEEVMWLSDRWLTLRDMEWAAGHGVSGSSTWYETWDLTTGHRVDLWRWFNARSGAWHEEAGHDGAEQVFTTSRALQKAIGPFDNNGGDPDCKDPGKSWRDPRLVSGGIEFEAGATGPCLVTAVVSFKALQPFLNEEGLRQVAALQREAVKP